MIANRLTKTILLICGLLFAPTGLEGQSSDRLEQMRLINPKLPRPLEIDPEYIVANGIDIITGKHVILFTDIRDRADVLELAKVFDAAVPNWCNYFGVDLDRADVWQLRAMIIADRQKFKQAQLMPESLPDFPAGFQTGHEMWVYLQPGNYYTRHLLIHEGTHSFMQWFLGGTGAPWYSEGMAELTAIHRWNDGNLKMNFRLTDRSQAEYWGRVKLIQEACQAGKAMSLEDIFNIPPTAFRDVQSYAWSWAACEFFSNHPNSRTAFDELKTIANKSPTEFNRYFSASINGHCDQLERDWQLFINEIDFGFDVAAGRLHPISSNNKQEFLVDSSLSWQATPLEVSAGQKLKISSSGRFTVAIENGNAWPSESNGITIEYYQGRPLGQLLIGVLGADGNIEGLLSPITLSGDGGIQFEKSGRLCFRINESPARLYDNEGKLTVSAVPVESR